MAVVGCIALLTLAGIVVAVAKQKLAELKRETGGRARPYSVIPPSPFSSAASPIAGIGNPVLASPMPESSGAIVGLKHPIEHFGTDGNLTPLRKPAAEPLGKPAATAPKDEGDGLPAPVLPISAELAEAMESHASFTFDWGQSSFASSDEERATFPTVPTQSSLATVHSNGSIATVHSSLSDDDRATKEGGATPATVSTRAESTLSTTASWQSKSGRSDPQDGCSVPPSDGAGTAARSVSFAPAVRFQSRTFSLR